MEKEKIHMCYNSICPLCEYLGSCVFNDERCFTLTSNDEIERRMKIFKDDKKIMSILNRQLEESYIE